MTTPAPDVYVRRIPSYINGDHPDWICGRHVFHDPRSLAYQVAADGTVADAQWQRVIAVLDQGAVGSCTGNAAVGQLGTQPDDEALAALIAAGLTLDEALALVIYSGAEDIDGDGPYPPNDNGSSGLSVAKVCVARGYISGYRHMTSLPACQTAIQTGPFIIGVNWYDSMDNPDAAGLVAVSGSIRGGHEVEVIAYRGGLWELVNSWGLGYGLAGHFFMADASLGRLLGEQGDATQFVPLSQPAPVPTPVPTPTPTPPAPTPVGRSVTFTAKQAHAIDRWASEPHHFSHAANVAAHDWLAGVIAPS